MRGKHIFIVLMVVFWASAGQIRAQEQSPADEAFLSFDKMTSIIAVDSVIGEPIRVQNTIVIPFAKIS